MVWKTIWVAAIEILLLCFAVDLVHAQGHPGLVHAAQTSSAVLPVGIVPPSLAGPSGDVSKNGDYNWSPAYAASGMDLLLEATGDQKWAAGIVDWGEHILAERDAISPTDQRPYAWTDRSTRVQSPYVWIAFTDHNFAPLMEFASYVLKHKELGEKLHQGKPYRDYALAYMHEYTRALDIDMAELARNGDRAYFRFAKRVPVANAKLNGQPLPVNMNAAMFTAMLYLANAEAAAGKPDVSHRLSALVADFVSYLKKDVFVSHACGDRTCIDWRYCTYMPRAEDVGHANLTVKFLVDAHNNGYQVSRGDLVGVADTFDNLLDSNGKPKGNLLDGSSVPGVANSIMYVMFLANYSPTLKTKLEHVMADNRNFTYWGPWLKATGGG